MLIIIAKNLQKINLFSKKACNLFVFTVYCIHKACKSLVFKEKNEMSNCYMLTSRGTLMPGEMINNYYDGSTHLADVQAPNGKVYTCRYDNVYDAQTGAIMLMHSRAETMAAEGYLITVRNDGRFRVYQRTKHGGAGGYIVLLADDTAHCTCPAFEKVGVCKHQMAVCSLLIRKAGNAGDLDWKAGETRYSRLAQRLAGIDTAPAPKAKTELVQVPVEPTSAKQQETEAERIARYAQMDADIRRDYY
jgi:hypothetical protein